MLNLSLVLNIALFNNFMEEIYKIGQIIKERRKSLNVTQNDLAEISGISARSLKDIEIGKGNPTLMQLIKILNSLGLKLNVKIKNEI
jgi:y4mF family transcriptional regulator